MSAPAPKTDAIRPKVCAPGVEREPRDEGQEHVEVERERADEHEGEERDGDAPRADGEAERLADACEDPGSGVVRGGRGASRIARIAQITTR